MLKINFSETPAEETWILHGRLTDPWVRELRAYWKKNHRTDAGRACIVDLDEVTFVDKSGERLLRMLASGGAQFTARGAYNKHIIEHLNVRRKRGRSNPNGCFIVLAFAAALGAGCERRVASATPPAMPAVEVASVIQKDVPLEGEWVATLEQPSQTWNAALSVSQPLFEGGALRSQLKLDRAHWQETVLLYQQTVQSVLEQVSNALVAYQKDRQFREQQQMLAQAAQRSEPTLAGPLSARRCELSPSIDQRDELFLGRTEPCPGAAQRAACARSALPSVGRRMATIDRSQAKTAQPKKEALAHYRPTHDQVKRRRSAAAHVVLT